MSDSNQSILAVIPARFGSTRFPGKSLFLIKDRPMIQWVYERASRSRFIDRVIVATDDDRIRNAVAAFGGEVVMTSRDHQTGTDRIAEVVRTIQCDLVVNVQGDEPLIEPDMIDEAIAPLAHDRSIVMGTICRRIEDRGEAFDTNVVKVVMDRDGFALYFSRAPIPWDRDRWSSTDCLRDLQLTSPLYKHMGLYVYRRDFLLTYASLPQTSLEQHEKLEQLRVLEHGHKIKVIVTRHESFGVDIPDDLSKILQRLQES